MSEHANEFFDPDRPPPLETVAHIRLLDLIMTIQVVDAARLELRGARASVAQSGRRSASIITDAIRKTEVFLGCKLFEPADKPGGSGRLTQQGLNLAAHGENFVKTIEAFRRLVTNPDEPRAHRSLVD
jgi:DNA-binding transcriptional LysR family regulator